MAMDGGGTSPFGERLRELRVEAGLTQQALARRSRLSEDAISALETGRRQRPHPITVRMLADGLGLDDEDRASLERAARREGRPRATAGPLPQAAVVVPDPPRSAGARRSRLAGRGRVLGLAVAGALAVAAAMAGLVPLLASGTGRTVLSIGPVRFVGSQAQPAAEYRAMVRDVLAGFPGGVDFRSQPSAAMDIETILDEEQVTGVSAIDLTDLTNGEMAALQGRGALTDLTPLLAQLRRDRRFPQALVDSGRFGTAAQYSIPWLQATYVMAVDRRALTYLPAGADVNDLTYGQLIAWGANIENATGQRRIGLPAALGGPSGGLITRFLQGYAYPSYTGTTLTDFRSPGAVQMWAMLRRLWAVTNPASTGYVAMGGPLESGAVWIAWDHEARLEGALAKDPGRYLVVPAPSGPMGLGFMTTIVGLAIPRGSANPAGARALIDWLTRPGEQAAASASLGFLPAVTGVDLAGPQAKEAAVALEYQRAPDAIETMPPTGLGAGSDAYNAVYQETFDRIVLRGEDIATVLDDEAGRLQRVVDDAGAPCWSPDPPSGGPCQIR